MVRAKPSHYLTMLKDFRDVHNQIRMNPQSYIPMLQQMKKRFKGKLYKMRDGTYQETKEGAPAVDEAIEYLKVLFYSQICNTNIRLIIFSLQFREQHL